MKVLIFLGCMFLASLSLSQTNVEISAEYVKDNKNFIYMKSKTETIKLKKAELTKEGVKQILKNKKGTLILFVPPAAVVKRTPLKKEEPEY